MSVLDQDFNHADFEVIVANDSGAPLLEAGWQASSRVRILNTNRRERCFARNSGAAIAKGEYLAFLDDDDWLLPGAFDRFWQLACQNREAVWLYGGIRIVDHQGDCLAEINSGLTGNCFAQIMGGAWAPIQASLVQSRAFFTIGGFSPFIRGTEDEDLCRRISYLGDFANTPAAVACLFRGQSWKTSTNYRRAPRDTRFSRDLLLSEPNSFTRLLHSAKSSYWFGRICRVYWSTAGWNISQKKYFTAVSRGLYGMAGCFLSGRHLITGNFWKGFRADHVPDTLHFVMKAQERKSKDTSMREKASMR